MYICIYSSPITFHQLLCIQTILYGSSLTRNLIFCETSSGYVINWAFGKL